jgi:hypothetical protein
MIGLIAYVLLLVPYDRTLYIVCFSWLASPAATARLGGTLA